MGHELADSIRVALRHLILDTYGDITAASKALGIPYKTLYRTLNPQGKDRTESVALDLVLDIVDGIQQMRPEVSFASVYATAERDVAGTPAPREALVSDDPVSLPTIDEDPELYGLAAKRGRKHTEEP